MDCPKNLCALNVSFTREQCDSFINLSEQAVDSVGGGFARIKNQPNIKGTFTFRGK